ncbi:MAG: NUDIX hydrolase [Pseudomonadota bacterium]
MTATNARDADETGRFNGWPRAAASVAVFKGAEILLARRGKPPVQNMWSLPGGHIEPGETASDAAMRELSEETGVEAELLGLVDVHNVIIRGTAGDLTAHYLIAVHAARWIRGTPVAADDIIDARFFDRNALGELEMTPRARELVDHAWVRFSSALVDPS